MTVVLGSHTQLMFRSDHPCIGLRSSWVGYWRKSEYSRAELMFSKRSLVVVNAGHFRPHGGVF